jgi:hypothetical protein
VLFAIFISTVVKYKVAVTTGGVTNGDTNAKVYLQLHGRMGTTGKRQLKKSDHEKMFQLDQVFC